MHVSVNRSAAQCTKLCLNAVPVEPPRRRGEQTRPWITIGRSRIRKLALPLGVIVIIAVLRCAVTHSCFLARTYADSGLTGQITLQLNSQAAPAGSRDVAIKRGTGWVAGAHAGRERRCDTRRRRRSQDLLLNVDLGLMVQFSSPRPSHTPPSPPGRARTHTTTVPVVSNSCAQIAVQAPFVTESRATPRAAG